MQKHKWYNEIVAWAAGAEIEWAYGSATTWYDCLGNDIPDFENENLLFRIKPQPKEPQYLYVYMDEFGDYFLAAEKRSREFRYKIKLEQDDE